MKLEGITFEGKPLEEWIKQTEDDQTTRDALAVMSAEVRERSLAILRGSGGARDWKQRNGAASRARRLTEDQIRKEYGVTAKPYKTQTENVIAIIKQRGEMTTQEIAEALEMKKASVSSLLSSLTRTLADVLRVEKVPGRAWTYGPFDPGLGLSVEQLREMHLKNLPQVLKPRARTSETPAKQAAETIPEMIAQEVVRDLSKLTLTVNVTGRIEIVFGWVGVQR